jgi:glycosyltransferase involved in cell wall biosynthesis
VSRPLDQRATGTEPALRSAGSSPHASFEASGGAAPGSNRSAPAISLLYRRCEATDAIGAYCERLEAALADAGAPSRIVAWRGQGIDVAQGAVILQYNPFSFGRWGFAPRLVLDMYRLGHRHPRTRRAVMVHEPFVPIRSVKSLVMGSWQRLQFRALLALADLVFVSTSSWNPRLPASCRPITAPVGSNLPDGRRQRAERRRAIDASPETIVLATFGTGHPSRLLGHVVAAANAVAAEHDRVMLLVLGTGAQPLCGLDESVTVRRPGLQSPDELAAELSAADIYLSAFVDGLSTRRTSLMAGLQHALAVVGTDGPLTEPDLRREEAAISWVSASDRAGFARAALALAGDPAARLRRGLEARRLYERRFSWERIAELTITAVAQSSR